ncbi:circularly permuted type 2 ATP-grasp protein [Arenicella xantha]|uniref:Putative circularly permuted ATP-grasp superfamily protein n=1 Tax=Arenicella xantha TaxID=644221 RepID=A0A395JNW2_9GAMM|nr:circularly permuted type 2 ATP-grasp protein [Arenicella xantha]RBP51268.1 putative circularly permuted ATP-grasp superfamily protein [Arenicella xantha]
MNTIPQRLTDYKVPDARIDEAFQADGNLKADWRYLLDSMATLGVGEIRERQHKAARILREDGASYNTYASSSRHQAWGLDLLPLLIPSAEWVEIEAGLQERAELFNLIFSDLYGKREIISRSLLPPELVFGHQSFLRSCQGLSLPGDNQIIVHGVDMIRRDNGRMCISSDRLQAPSGLGYALENRNVMGRVLPSLLRENQVHRLTSFFQVLRQKLISLAPQVDSPRIVVLTPGPYNETYFEHAFLANYLGFSLVQSGDLVVRNGYVWMRTLKGLTRVDVILRRVDELYCDPVELRPDSKLGLPGLLQVARAGNVAIANPLGSGFMENPVLYRFLPDISKHFLGRPLRLESAKTWWCGDQDDYQFVLANLDDLVVKSVARGIGLNSKVVSELSDQQVNELTGLIKSQPQNYVAQEKLTPSHVPTLDQQEVVSRPIILRSFAVASEDASYRVLPGGLTRVGATESATTIANHLGSFSKDTWVTASEPEKHEILSAQLGVVSGYTEGAELPSRVVENLFWMGRYMERAETSLRYVRTLFIQLNGVQSLPQTCRATMLKAATHITSTYPGFVNNSELLNNPNSELLSILLDQNRIGSVAHSVTALIACAEQLPGLLSSDSQRIINQITDELDMLASDLSGDFLSAPEEPLGPLLSNLLALAGIVNESMIRDTGWLFVELGRRMERASQTASLLRALLFSRLGDFQESITLETLGMSVESLISYRRRFGGALKTNYMLELVLMDASNPRSIEYQLKSIVNTIYALPRERRTTELSAQLRFVMEAQSKVQLSKISQLSIADAVSESRMELDQLCGQIHKLLGDAYNALSVEYFTQAAGPQQLVEYVGNLN